MDRVVEICERHGLMLVEDCAHACGVKWRGRQLGYHGKVRLCVCCGRRLLRSLAFLRRPLAKALWTRALCQFEKAGLRNTV